MREVVGDLPLDRLVFTGDGAFVDANGQFWLKSDVLKLWLRAGGETALSNKPTPHRLQGLGHVTGASDDAIIENTDYLTAMFVEAPKPTASALPPTVATGPASPVPIIQPVSRSPQEPAKPKPARMSARKIDVWLQRFASDEKAANPKYEMQEARCDDRVVVIQPPADPKKAEVGLDIRGGSLLLKKRANGHEMTVTGATGEIARVRFENVTICGPEVKIDQPSNSVAVVGGGWMRMPSSSNLAGSTVDEKSEITIHWQEKMEFHGERRTAWFIGQVQAVQALAEGVVSTAATVSRSSVACHEMNVTFDKPIYFNQMNRRDAKKPESDPKVEAVVCTPASEDSGAIAVNRAVLYLEETTDRLTKKTVKAQQIEAKLLEMQVKDKGQGDDGSYVRASGPGTTRLLQLGSKDNPGGPQPANAKGESEMKLTVVRFNGHLEMLDKKSIFQKAVFSDTVRVAYVPSESLRLTVDEFAEPPPRSMFLRCNRTFTVTSHRAKTAGAEDERSMEAVEGAEMKTDDYIGKGDTITYDGTKVILKADGDGQATLWRTHRPLTGPDYKSGNPLIYNVKTGQVSGAQSSGGSFTTPK
jgi:hypothetical protein